MVLLQLAFDEDNFIILEHFDENVITRLYSKGKTSIHTTMPLRCSSDYLLCQIEGMLQCSSVVLSFVRKQFFMYDYGI